jgi:hypothetical protein
MPWQGLSPEFKHSDLKTLSRADGVSFNHVVDGILAAADKEGKRPTRVPQGYLAERVVTNGGHTTTTFYGQPTSWMARFMPAGRAVTRINRFDTQGNITGAFAR